MTLALFFASGMYEEKIRYAHRWARRGNASFGGPADAFSYINHSNKALRPLNMHLNMRLPRFSVLTYLPWISSSVTTPSSTATIAVKAPLKLANRRPSSNTIMATIPPSSNPRGELIFSSRVDKGFREGYERYRAAFERRREEKAREARGRGWKTMWGSFDSPTRASASPTPPVSRRGTPPPGSGLGGRSSRAPSPGVPRVGSALRSENSTDEKGSGTRERADSYSFVLSGLGTREPPLRPHA